MNLLFRNIQENVTESWVFQNNCLLLGTHCRVLTLEVKEHFVIILHDKYSNFQSTLNPIKQMCKKEIIKSIGL